ncbi:hypothetical protein K435DRAFT_872038 [Dendrothele bispora CBS 962.96]|uniref:Uncharacterized protein n=1 Tax=Dendrothele bispora (strain CBS 962.96) TaxID=1314807 RepID=A0A4S8L2L8_DENBC|nr:hypothetical protein K435DRAFT_872038 [Dendrothele bispora CBS 962.96]
MVPRCQRFQLLELGLKATGVQYTLSSTSPKQTINMIMNNKTQGHLPYSTTFSVTTPGSIHASQSSYSQSPEPMSFISSATAYLPLSSLFTSQSDLQSLISSTQSSMHAQIQACKTSGCEVTGPGDQADDTVSGKINSLLLPILYSQFISGRSNPPANEDTSDADWDSFIFSSSSTEFHPPSSCASLPLSLGGVVYPSTFRVYGSTSVRVINASLLAEMSAHIGAPTYGVREVGVGLLEAECDGNRDGSGLNVTDNNCSSGHGSAGSGRDAG